MMKNKKVGMIIGRRVYLYDEPKIFLFGNKIIRLAHLVLNRVNVRDPLSGLRIIRLNVLENGKLLSKGFDIEIELNCLVKRKGFQIYEVPIGYRQRVGVKKLRIHHAINIFKRILLCSVGLS